MKKTNIEDIIEEKYIRYINCETDIIGLTLEEAKFILETGERRNYVTSILQEAAKVILSDYKRVLKENEELLQEKINNQKIIALAQNDMLNYQAGFEDGKNGRTSAVQSIIENQQYYIFQKQIEKYERHIEKLQKENEKALAEYMKWQKQELGQKDKIIDLMANHIATSDSDLCEYLDITTKCKYYAGDNGKTCDNCIKQYFENKAKEIK